MKRSIEISAMEDEYARWCNEPTEHIQLEGGSDSEDLVAYWNSLSRRAAYPKLPIMALELLAIPGMPAEVERVFSSAKLLISDRRYRLKEDTIEACECIRHWASVGIIKEWDV